MRIITELKSQLSKMYGSQVLQLLIREHQELQRHLHYAPAQDGQEVAADIYVWKDNLR